MEIGIDLDGVVYNFVASIAQYVSRRTGLFHTPIPSSWHFYEDDWGMSPDRFLGYCNEGVDDGVVFATGEPIPGTWEAMMSLRIAGHKLHIITDRRYGTKAKANTELFLERTKLPYDSLVFAADKTLLRLDMAIDDLPKNVDAWRAVGTEAWLMDCQRSDQVGHPYLVADWNEFLGKVWARGPGILVGLAGRARSGKDTIGGVLVDNFGFRRLAWADKVKQAALALNPYVDVFGSRLTGIVADVGMDQAKMDPEIRRILQVMGTEAGREIHGGGLWVDALRSDIQSTRRPTVITDTRFPNEVAAIRAMGGIVVRLTRESSGLAIGNAHASEAQVDGLDVDLEVANNGTPEQAANVILHYLESHGAFVLA